VKEPNAQEDAAQSQTGSAAQTTSTALPLPLIAPLENFKAEFLSLLNSLTNLFELVVHIKYFKISKNFFNQNSMNLRF
jgi:hypothetical protein